MEGSSPNPGGNEGMFMVKPSLGALGKFVCKWLYGPAVVVYFDGGIGKVRYMVHS